MDKTIKKIIKEIAQEEGLTEGTVEKCVRTLTDWTRKEMIAMKYPAIMWPWFGTFEILPTRVTGDLKERVLEYQNRKSKKNAKEESITNEVTQCIKDDED